MDRFIGWTVVFCLALTFSSVAAAKTERELGYRYPVIWKTAVRFVRVDLGAPLLEKDKEAGYLLFEYKDGGRTSAASIEIFEILKNGRQMVKLRLQIPALPSYVEGVLVDKLLRKLKNEYGLEPVLQIEKPEPPASKAGKQTEDEPPPEGGEPEQSEE